MSKHSIYVDYPQDTKRGRVMNAFMRTITILAVIFMIVASVKTIEKSFYQDILLGELIISCIFLADFLVRAYLSGWKASFFKNIFNIFDLIASVPFILAFGFQGYVAFGYLKILRVTRICRIFRLGKYFTFLTNFGKAIKKNAYKYKIAGVFFLLCLLISSFVMYTIEGTINPGFSDIPSSMRWSLVTMSTVGYGDIYPISIVGKIAGGVVILLGPIFLAIISSISIVTFLDVMRFINKEKFTESMCDKCKSSPHETDAQYCRVCGEKLSSSNSEHYILDNY